MVTLPPCPTLLERWILDPYSLDFRVWEQLGYDDRLSVPVRIWRAVKRGVRVSIDVSELRRQRRKSR